MADKFNNYHGCASRRAPAWNWGLISLAVTALSLAGVCPLRADIFTPSVQDQIKLGDQAAEQVMKKNHVLHDERSQRVEAVGQRLLNALSAKERGPWNYRFYVIDGKEINAFALPGGNVFVFTGLYDRIQSEDALAGVMGHELTHVREQHWAKMAGAQAKRQAELSVLLGVTRAGPVWQNIAGLSDSLLSLRYSRKDEDQADAEGLQDLVAAGYNPQGMLDLFRLLTEAAGKGEGPAFLADHPLTKDRIQKTQERIDHLGRHDFPPEVPLRRST
jgi:predicted Zn-dependent protease